MLKGDGQRDFTPNMTCGEGSLNLKEYAYSNVPMELLQKNFSVLRSKSMSIILLYINTHIYINILNKGPESFGLIKRPVVGLNRWLRLGRASFLFGHVSIRLRQSTFCDFFLFTAMTINQVFDIMSLLSWSLHRSTQ